MSKNTRIWGGISGLALLGSGAYFAYTARREQPFFFTATAEKRPASLHKMTVNNKFEVGEICSVQGTTKEILYREPCS
jgi:hypothetical protein